MAEAIVVAAVDTDTWKAAITQSASLLSDRERSRFGESTPAEILRDFQHGHVQRSEANKIHAFVRRIQPLISTVERFGKALDVIASVSPEAMSPTWGAIRVLLMIAQDYDNYFNKLVDMLQYIGDALPRFHAYDQLFHHHIAFQLALLSTYREILTFITQAKAVFRKPGFRLLARVLWRTFEQTFQDSLSQLRRYADLVEREAKLAHMIEESQARLELTRLAKLVSEQRPLSPRLSELRRWLDARQCNEERDGFHLTPGTGDWAIHHTDVVRWMENEAAQTLWLHGGPGCGKSYLYARFLTELSSRAQPTLCFLFCGADKERVTTTSLLRSWIFQLANVNSDAQRYVTTVAAGSETRHASARDVQEMFWALLDFLPPCYLTVDAIDECDDRVEFCQILSKVPRRFKVLITSRPLPELANFMNGHSKSAVSLEITPDITRPDLERYVTHQLQKPEMQFSPAISSRIREASTTRSDGMFLWVRLLLQEISDQTTDEEVLACLGDELPEGLTQRYDRMMQRISELPKAKKLLAHKVFFWMSTARRPLKAKELCAFLAVKPLAEGNDGFSRQRRLSSDPGSTILAVCCSLVVARGADRTIYPMHFTVTEYLRSFVQGSSLVADMARHYELDQLQSSNALAAAVCVKYLSLDLVSDIREKGLPSSHADACAILQSDDPDLDLLSYAVAYWSYHAQQTVAEESQAFGLICQFLERQPSLEVFWRLYWFLGQESLESVSCPHLSGVHVAAYFNLHLVLPGLSQIEVPDSKASWGRTALWWAANMDCTEAAITLLDSGADPTIADDLATTPAHRAAARGNAKLLRAFMGARNEHLDRPLVDGDGWTPLHLAASRGHMEAVQEIIRQRTKRSAFVYGTETSLTQGGRTPLHIAALNGHEQLMLWLGGHRGSFSPVINLRDSQGQTALHLAAARGHLETVKSLLERGALVGVMDQKGHSAADKAYNMGNEAVRQLLRAEMRHQAEGPSQTLEAVADRLRRYEIEDMKDIAPESSRRYLRSERASALDGQDISPMHALVNGHKTSMTIMVLKERAFNTRDSRGRTLLHYAAAIGELHYVQGFRHGSSRHPVDANFVNIRDDRGWTALHYAVVEGHSKVIAPLIGLGAAADVKNKAGDSPLDLAFLEGNEAVAEALVRCRDVPTGLLRERLGWNDMHVRGRSNTVKVVDTFLVHEKDVLGKTPLFRAFEAESAEAIDLLEPHTPLTGLEVLSLAHFLSKTEDTALLHRLLRKLPSLAWSHDPVAASHAHTLLFKAAGENDMRSLEFLTDAGVDINAVDPNHPGQTALGVAMESEGTEAAIHLLECGADIDATSNGYPALHTACREGLIEVVRNLLRRGVDVNASGDSSGSTPLCALFLVAYLMEPDEVREIATALLDHGADPLAPRPRDSAVYEAYKRWFSSFHYAEDKSGLAKPGLDPILKLLVERGYGMLIRPVTREGLAPIHVAARDGDVEGVRRELDSGVPVDWLSLRDGLTAMEVARRAGREDVMGVLKASGG